METRYFSYNVYDPDHEDNGYVRTVSEQEILDEYWEWWKNAMIAKYGEGHELINEQECINDFVVCHWAWEVEDDD